MTNEVFANSPNPGTVSAIGTLAANVTSSATTWTINSALPAVLQTGGQFHALIDHEIVIIPTQTGTTLTGITRGSSLASPDTCTSSSHSAGALIYPLLTAGALENALAGAGGGGGGGAVGVATLGTGGNAGTGVTCQNPVTYGMQVTTLNLPGAVITMPTAVAGAIFRLFLLDPSGGTAFTISYSTLNYPSGTPVPITSPGVNILDCACYDGTTWEVTPGTSGPTVISVLGTLITGASGLGPVRELGGQATGSAPGYTPSGSNLEIVPDTGLPGGFGFWVSAVGSTSWVAWGPTGGGGSLPSGQALQGFALNRSNTAVIAESREMVDITAQTWTGYVGSPSTAYNVGTGVTDNGPGLMAAATTLSGDGKIGYVPAGTYPYKTQLVFGNGSGISGGTTFTPSTWQPYFRGASVQGVNSLNSQASVFKWTGATGYASPLAVIQGPIYGWEFTNLVIDGNSTYTGNNAAVLGLQINSAQNGVYDFLRVLNTHSGIQHTTVGAKGANCSMNTARQVNVQITGGSVSGLTYTYGVQFTNGTLAGSHGNTCYELYEDLIVQQTTGTGGGTNFVAGVAFQCCDSCRIDTLHIAQAGISAAVVYDYSTSANQWPAGCVIEGHFETGGNTCSLYEMGSIGGVAAGGCKNVVLIPPSAVNGLCPDQAMTTGTSALTSLNPIPLLKMVTYGGEYLRMPVTIVSGGTQTVNCPFATTGFPVEAYLITPGGTPGAAVQASVTSSGVITINSYNATGSLQTADTSTYMLRLIK